MGSLVPVLGRCINQRVSVMGPLRKERIHQIQLPETTMDLSPGGIIAWILVGLIAGWAAGKVSRGHGFGLIGDLVVGLIGALIGGLIGGAIVQGSVGFVGSVIVAFLGALLLLVITRLLSGSQCAA